MLGTESAYPTSLRFSYGHAADLHSLSIPPRQETPEALLRYHATSSYLSPQPTDVITAIKNNWALYKHALGQPMCSFLNVVCTKCMKWKLHGHVCPCSHSCFISETTNENLFSWSVWKSCWMRFILVSIDQIDPHILRDLRTELMETSSFGLKDSTLWPVLIQN
jgi:hypothetical protein